ncbi:MAG: hypothetical protein JRF36_04745 [Deltaproteobacteria bacterium]|jgi:hypothetical protein|nr:hypothetical protein [Deltaproteobacteria bacterium]
MYKNLLKIFLLLILVVVILFPGNSFAFKSLTRDQLIYDAIEFCPTELREYLRHNLLAVVAGMHFKERHPKRIYAIAPYDTEIIYKSLISDLKQGRYDEFNTAHTFGVLACFLAETISPDNYKTPAHLIPERVRYDGYQRLNPDNVKSNLRGLIENYRIPCRQVQKREVTDQLYNVALNEIVDYWVSAWKAGGFQPGTFARLGHEISHVNLVLNAKTNQSDSGLLANSESDNPTQMLKASN